MLQPTDPIIQEISKIARGFDLFACIPCARAIQQFMMSQNVSGVKIQLDTGSQDSIYGRIYDDSIEDLIATTGHHEGILLMIEEQQIVFDNIHVTGISKAAWLANLYSPIFEIGRTFQVTETSF
jgi:hypothetical protein